MNARAAVCVWSMQIRCNRSSQRTIDLRPPAPTARVLTAGRGAINEIRRRRVSVVFVVVGGEDSVALPPSRGASSTASDLWTDGRRRDRTMRPYRPVQRPHTTTPPKTSPPRPTDTVSGCRDQRPDGWLVALRPSGESPNYHRQRPSSRPRHGSVGPGDKWTDRCNELTLYITPPPPLMTTGKYWLDSFRYM